MSVSNHSQAVTLSESLASRYEALARIAELIRSHPEEKVLFQTFASDLHQVVPFDCISQFDSAANWVHWHFLEPYDTAIDALAVRNIPKEETVAWWVYQNQQPVVIPFIDRETSFPLVVQGFSKLGLRSLCALPLSTAHRKLGSLVFASHLDDAYSHQDQQFLSVVANQIAVALDDARAQARLRLLLDITNRIVTKLELRDLLREIVASIRHFDGSFADDGQPGTDRDGKPAYRRRGALTVSREANDLRQWLIGTGTKTLYIGPVLPGERLLRIVPLAQGQQPGLSAH